MVLAVWPQPVVDRERSDVLSRISRYRPKQIISNRGRFRCRCARRGHDSKRCGIIGALRRVARGRGLSEGATNGVLNCGGRGLLSN